jgi:hypothetical protein
MGLRCYRVFLHRYTRVKKPGNPTKLAVQRFASQV